MKTTRQTDEYISRNRILAEIGEIGGHLYSDWETAGVISLIARQPKADVVEVTRCSECKQWCRNLGLVDSPNGHCFYHDIETNGYDFCSYGKREGENG